MNILRRVILGWALLCLAPLAALAQGGFGNTTGYVVTDCGTVSPAFVAGRPGPFTVDVNGNLCMGGAGTAGANALNGQISSAMTATTSTAVAGMGAQGAGVRVYVTACTVANTHASVGTMVNLQDGSGGTVLWQLPAGPSYNGAHTVFPTPIRTTANVGLFAVNATTGASTLLSCTGYRGA